MAASSSFPELATIVLAGWPHGDFELGLASVIGSAIFHILVIPGLSVAAIWRGSSLRVNTSRAV
jgi:cation:H+ antiporter